MAPTLYYSPHFSRREMTFSETAARRGIDNSPPEAIEKSLVQLCNELLEPVREHFGAISVASGYRCPALNAAVGGAARSAHMDGRAADVKPVDPAITLREIVGWVIASQLPFDQVIYEFGSWVHLAIPPAAAAARRQALMIFAPERYLAFDAGGIPADRVA